MGLVAKEIPMPLIPILLIVGAIILFGLGALVEGLFWLIIVGVIAAIVAIALGVGSARRGVGSRRGI
jgi:hypothetical protein